jgi:two-component sensor histidine kinase
MRVGVFDAGDRIAHGDLDAELLPKGKVNLTFQDNASNETGFVVEQSVNGGAWTVVKNIKANKGVGTIICTLTGLKAGDRVVADNTLGRIEGRKIEAIK